jgi:dolichyl-diphosphooligosaccharide--protein glycosyltransferase
MFGFGFLLLPIALFCSPPQLFSKGGQIIRDWFVFFLLLGLYSVRFVRWMAFMPALFSAILLFQLFLGLKQKILSSSKNNYFFKLNLAKICISILPLMLLIFLLNYPNFSKTQKIKEDEVEFFNWIRINTPETSGYSDFNEPEYGILSFWDEGNRISYYCKRPVLVNNALWGYKKMAAIFSATSEDEAYRLARKYKARYIFINSRKITDQYMDVLNMYKNKADADDVIFNYSYNYVPAKKAISKYSDSFHFWLSNQAAIKSSGHFDEPASNFRIIYSSKQKDRYTAPRILLYECVAGCEIKGLVDPGSEVLLSIGCSFDKTEQLYKRKQVADENGMVSFRTPYSTSYKKGRVITQSYYKVSYVRNGIQKFAKLTINENQIINGASLNIIDDATIQFDESSENH